MLCIVLDTVAIVVCLVLYQIKRLDKLYVGILQNKEVIEETINICHFSLKLNFLPFHGTIHYTFICHFSLKNFFFNFSLVFLYLNPKFRMETN